MRVVPFIFCLVMFITNTIEACTLFAANGELVDGGGSLIAKNRDFKPQNQEVRLVTNGKYAYYGLFSKSENGNWSVKAGVNEKGLAVVSAMSSCIPGKLRKAMKSKPFMSLALKSYASVAEFLEHKDELLGPRFIMVADSKEIACVEVGDMGKLSVQRGKNSVLSHTNHYLDEELQNLNIKIGESSLERLKRINTLLKSEDKPFELINFVQMSQDKNAGLNNSIWRIGEPNTSQTLASFIVLIKPDNDFKIYLKYRPTIDMQGKEFVLVLPKEDIFG